MRLDGDNWILSPTDLSEFLACEHLTRERSGSWNGDRAKDWPQSGDDPHTAIVKRRGNEHEARQIALLEKAAGEAATDLSIPKHQYPRTTAEMIAAAGRTVEAMRQGPKLIIQAAVFDASEPWFADPDEEGLDSGDIDSGQFGFVDALRRVDGLPSALGDYSYEVVEIKLSKQLRPKFVHQASLYTRALGAMQGRTPDLAYLRLGDGREEPIQIARYSAAHRQAEKQLRSFITGGSSTPDVPEPVAHCQLCPLESECEGIRRAADHLSLVAGASSTARETLEEIGIATLADLASAEGDAPKGLASETWEKLRNQARLQLKSRDSGEPVWENREPRAGTGYSKLPPADDADIFFDLEGDPYEGDEGLEYLWGWCDAEGNYEYRWAHDEVEEQKALEEFIDLAHAAWKANPEMHIYFYAPHEKSKLGSLTLKYGTRESKLDDLLRAGTLVDLLAVVRQAMQVGEESYSLKKLERHHGFDRTEETVRGGGGSIVAYEQFLTTTESGEHSNAQSFLDAIREYNKDDCLSTLSLRNWLLAETKPQAEKDWPDADFTYVPPEETRTKEWQEDVAELVDALLAELPESRTEDDPDESAKRLLANLLLFHWREDKVFWWRYYELMNMRVEELFDETDAIGPLSFDSSSAPEPVKRSLAYRFTFPPQDFKMSGGSLVSHSPNQGVRMNVHDYGDDWLQLKVASSKPRPEIDGALCLRSFDPAPMRNAIADFARAVLNADETSFPASSALLRRLPPSAKEGSLALDKSGLCDDVVAVAPGVFAVQGPPGTGKTHNAAEMVLRAIADGKTVGITAPSHKAIQNLLKKIEEKALEIGTDLRGGYKAGSEHKDSWEAEEPQLIPVADDPFNDAGLNLAAGTEFACSAASARLSVDILFIDEAGQYSLASAIAASTAARESVVLLGDPQQLAQVRHATHPEGAECSALEHLISPDKTIRPDRGVLLDESWRMHPHICSFISWMSYEERLEARPECSAREIRSSGHLSGSGIRFIEARHSGCSQYSAEEAALIASLCKDLLAGDSTVIDLDDKRRPYERRLVADDIMVVAPFNMAVTRIHDAVPNGVRVGTVDKFQGQEAPVVFYAMTCSSAEAAPRGMSFLFEANRFNVAVSRAQCLSIVVANPRLLDAPVRTVEQLELVNNLCEYRERARLVEIYATEAMAGNARREAERGARIALHPLDPWTERDPSIT